MVRGTYELVYSDADVPTHYDFKVPGRGPIASVERRLADLEKRGREAVMAAREPKWGGPVTDQERADVTAVIDGLDDIGRWTRPGRFRERIPEEELPDSVRAMDPEQVGRRQWFRSRFRRVETDVLSSRTFANNIRKLSRFVAKTR